MATQNSINLTAGANITLTPSGSGLAIAAGPSTVGFTAYLSDNVPNFCGNTTPEVVVVCDSNLFNAGGGYNPSNGVFTAPVEGYYLVSAAAAISNITLGSSFAACLNDPFGNIWQGNVVNPAVSKDANGIISSNISTVFYINAASQISMCVRSTGEAADSQTLLASSGVYPTYFSAMLLFQLS